MPLFRKCATQYNYEPHLPTELRYEKEKTVGLVSKLHPVTGFLTPYFREVIGPTEFKEVPSPYMLKCVSLRPKEEVRMDLVEVRNMGWERIFLLIQACYTAVRVKIDSERSVVRESGGVQLFQVPHPHSTLKLRNGHRHTIAIRYFFTDDIAGRNPLSFTSNTQIHVDSPKTTCNSLTVTLYHSQPETQYCVIATQIPLIDYKLTDYETSKCMNPVRAGVNEPENRRKWESCQITPGESSFALDAYRQTDITLSGLSESTNLAVEVFALPTNNYYALHVWSKVGDIFTAKTSSCYGK